MALKTIRYLCKFLDKRLCLGGCLCRRGWQSGINAC